MDELANVPSGKPPAVPPPKRATQPPHPLDGSWYLHSEGTTYGPYTGREFEGFVAEGRVDASSQVVPIGEEAEWRSAGDDPKLSLLFRRASRSPAPPPIKAAAGATVVQVNNVIGPSSSPILVLDDDGMFGPKSAGAALFLSFLFCGVGQIYCGRVAKGILMMIGCVLLWFVLLGWIVNLWSMIDAYSTAKKMNLRYQRRRQAQLMR